MSEYLNFLSYNDDPELLSDRERIYLISTLDDHVLIDSIIDQLRTLEIEYMPEDFLSLFESRITFLENKYADDTEMQQQLDTVRLGFYSELVERFRKLLHLTIHTDDFQSIREWQYLVNILYNFFVMAYRENLIDFFFHYIQDHRSSLLKAIKPNAGYQSVFKELKKRIPNRDSLKLYYYLPQVLGVILEHDLMFEEVIRYIIVADPDEYHNSSMYTYVFDEQRIGCDEDTEFCKKYFDVLYYKKMGYMLIIRELQSIFFDISSQSIFDKE